MIEMEVLGMSSVKKLITQAIYLALQEKTRVYFTVNKVTVIVEADSPAGLLHRDYQAVVGTGVRTVGPYPGTYPPQPESQILDEPLPAGWELGAVGYPFVGDYILASGEAKLVGGLGKDSVPKDTVCDVACVMLVRKTQRTLNPTEDDCGQTIQVLHDDNWVERKLLLIRKDHPRPYVVESVDGDIHSYTNARVLLGDNS